MGEQDDKLDEFPADELLRPEQVEQPGDVLPEASKDELRARFEATTGQPVERAKTIVWIADRCPDDACEDTCVGSTRLEQLLEEQPGINRRQRVENNADLVDLVSDIWPRLGRYFGERERVNRKHSVQRAFR